MFKNKILLSFKIAIFLILIFLCFKFINQNEFLSVLSQVKLTNIFLIYLLFLPMPFLMTVRWFIIIKNFSKISFLDFLKNIVHGFSFSLILSSTLALEAVKFIKIKKELGNKKSLSLIFLDKFLALFFKIIFLVFGLIVFYYQKENNDVILILSLISLILLIIFFNLNKILNVLIKNFYFIKKYKIILDMSMLLEKNIFKLFSINLTIQLLNISVYYLIFLFLTDNHYFFKLMIFIPLVEFLSQLQFLIIGMKELSTVFLFTYINIPKETSLVGALVYVFVDYLIVISFYVFFGLKNYLKIK